MTGAWPIDLEQDGVVDCHAHVGKWCFDAEGETLDCLRKLDNDFGISRSVVMISLQDKGGTDNYKANEQLLNDIGNDGRFFFFYWIDPRVDAIEDIEAMGNHIHGLKLHPSHTRTRVSSKTMKPFLEWCERNGKPLLVHCGRWQEYSSCRFAIETAKEHTFPLIIAHMGGPSYELKVGALDMLRNVAVDNIFLDTSTCFQPNLIRKAVDIIGETHVLFGSDYPLYHPALGIQAVLLAGLSDKLTSSILRDNAARLLDVRRRSTS
jgi:predicted TIM-barrel fold metal-dependent hydrolase